jgi:hypothetical protein
MKKYHFDFEKTTKIYTKQITNLSLTKNLLHVFASPRLCVKIAQIFTQTIYNQIFEDFITQRRGENNFFKYIIVTFAIVSERSAFVKFLFSRVALCLSLQRFNCL